MSASRVLVLGTGNQKKRRELEILLAPLGFTLRTLVDFPNAIDVVEDGESFAENAAKKASEQAVHLGQWVLGEDSGLCVDALKGAPGIYSARFSGPGATDDSNNALLIEKLSGVPRAKRTAHYVCHMAIAAPTGEIVLTSEDTCHGILRELPAGRGGFGYDPLFEIPEYRRTFGELGDSIKSVLSHRAKASRKLARRLADQPEVGVALPSAGSES